MKSYKTRSISYCIVVILLWSSAAIRFGRDIDFVDGGEISLIIAAQDYSNAIRSRNFYLPSHNPRVAVGEIIEFVLFDDEIIVGKVSKIVNRGSEGVTWFGSLHFPSSQTSHGLEISDDKFTLACLQDVCSARMTVESTKSTYVFHPTHGESVSSAGERLHRLQELGARPPSGTQSLSLSINTDVINNEAEEKYLHDSEESLLQSESSLPVDEEDDKDLIIDVGVMYTPQALALLGNRETAMRNAIHLATDECNDIMERSEVQLRLRNVFMKPTDNSHFIEPVGQGAAATLLNWLKTAGDGQLDEAHVYRSIFKPDLVVMVIADDEFAGLAYVNFAFTAEYTYAVFNVRYVNGMVWAHELGHLQGCSHDRFSAPRSLPNYNGYGHCWEDRAKTDCTCYSSVMVEECRTEEKGCTKCTERPYYANVNVVNAGSTTGLDIASCAAFINKHKFETISYQKSLYNSGLIFSVSPSSVLISSCVPVNISGWMLAYGGDIESVTLSGVNATILSSSLHWVVVQSPNVTAGSIRAGSVVVTTDNGRVTVLEEVFTFFELDYISVTDFSRGVGHTYWEGVGPVGWTTSFNRSVNQDFKAESAYVINKNRGRNRDASAVLQSLSIRDMTGDSNCYDTMYFINFQYWSYSPVKDCFGHLSLHAKTSTGQWTRVWIVKTDDVYGEGFYDNLFVWKTVTSTLIPDTRAVKFKLEADSGLTNCKLPQIPLSLRGIALSVKSFCADQSCLAPVQILPFPPDPTIKPTSSPTTAPTHTPSSPSIMPTSSAPTVIPLFKLIYSMPNHIVFNGYGTFLHQDSLPSSFSSFTVCAWIKTTRDGMIVSFGRNQGQSSGRFSFSVDTHYKKLHFADYGPLGYEFQGYSLDKVNTGERLHVAFVKDELKGTFYIDGKKSGELSARNSLKYTNKNLFIGADYVLNIFEGKYRYVSYFNGEMDSVRIYQGVLEENQIQEILDNTKIWVPPPSSKPTVRVLTLKPTRNPKKKKKRRNKGKNKKKKRRKNKNKKRKRKNKRKNKNKTKTTMSMSPLQNLK
mmetsp:Transcript_12291/g.12381  ORF Transcript_12291/g.12381 Transcript_12291/m.12381 type:complete len:1035 (+) Transcript_12291:161-3265(+)